MIEQRLPQRVNPICTGLYNTADWSKTWLKERTFRLSSRLDIQTKRERTDFEVQGDEKRSNATYAEQCLKKVGYRLLITIWLNEPEINNQTGKTNYNRARLKQNEKFHAKPLSHQTPASD